LTSSPKRSFLSPKGICIDIKISANFREKTYHGINYLFEILMKKFSSVPFSPNLNAKLDRNTPKDINIWKAIF